MKRFVPVLFTLACLFTSAESRAQFQNHFTVYVDQSATTDTTFIQTVTIEGYTQVPSSMPTNGVTHHPVIQNRVGSNGGSYNGSNTCPSCYINFSNTVNDIPGSLIDDDNVIASVVCSVAGTFFNVFQYFQVEAAYTRTKSFPPATCVPLGNGQICTVAVGAWCTAATTPPDFNPTVAGGLNPTSIPPYFDNHTICFRASGTKPWTCAPTVAFPLPDNQLQAVCTHNP